MRYAPSTHRRNRSKGRHRLLLSNLLLGGLLASLMPEGVSAQPMRWEMPDSVKPTRSVYNVDDNEFLVGALLVHWLNEEPGDSVGVLWDFTRFMSVSDWVWSPLIDRGPGEPKRAQLDTLLDLAEVGERLSVAVLPIERIGGHGQGGGGQMIEVFLFDSVQSPYFRWEFLGVDTGKGEMFFNDYYDNSGGENFDWPWKNAGPRERRFTDSTEAGLIAEHLAIHYDPIADAGWIDHLENNESHSAQSSFLQYLFSGDPEDRKLSVALKGHLSETLDPNVVDTDTIFIIELVHVIPDGRKYIESGTTYTVSTYTERIVDSFAVTKGDLYAGTDPIAKYRDISFTHDLRYRFGVDTLDGVMPEGYLDHGAGGSPVVDVKVYWTGKEEPSVRSIMLRNPTAQLMYGTSQQGDDFREEVLDVARRMLHGVNSSGETKINDPIRPGLMRFDASHESSEYGYGSYRAILRYLTDSLVYNSGADSIPPGAINHNPVFQHHALHVGELQSTAIEYGYWDFGYDGKYPALPAGRQVGRCCHTVRPSTIITAAVCSIRNRSITSPPSPSITVGATTALKAHPCSI